MDGLQRARVTRKNLRATIGFLVIVFTVLGFVLFRVLQAPVPIEVAPEPDVVDLIVEDVSIVDETVESTDSATIEAESEN